jgi:saccharopine dehydrogenase (NAD+, L-lysine-forming)
MLKIGILREEKVPHDRRVAFTPEQCKHIESTFNVKIIVQPSDWRVIKDSQYTAAGITLRDNLTDCDILIGIKEVPAENLIPEKKYLFFSHTIKKQAHNKKLMKALIEKKICMIDYETMTDEHFNRIIGFGHYAGIVGTYNGILGYGLKYNLFNLKRAVDCADMNEVKEELKKVNLPNLKIIITGNGRVANGAIELAGMLHLRRITPYEFTHYTFREPTYTQLHSSNYNEPLDGSAWNTEKFYSHPDKFRSTFMKYARFCDLLIHCSYWNPKAPLLFTKQEMKSPEFGISVIADVTCDINGSIPSTTKASTIAEPFYGYDTKSEQETTAFSKDAITVMAIDNLPCELPLNASEDFGKELIDKVLPFLLKEDNNEMIERATIVKNGKLMPRFDYLKDYTQ